MWAVTLSNFLSLSHHQGRQSFLDLDDKSGIGAFLLVVPYSKIGPFPQFTIKIEASEKNSTNTVKKRIFSSF